MVEMMAVLNVRVQGKKCIFLRSPKSVEEDARVGFTPNGFRVVVDERRATVVTCAAPPTRRTRGLSSRFQKKQHWGLLFDDDATREVVPVTAPNIRTWIEEHVDGPWLVGNKVLVSDMVAGTVVSYNEDSRQGVVRYKLKKGKQKEVTKDTRFSVHDLLLAKCRWAAGTILLTTTNADGVMSTMECTGVLPKYNEHGKTDEEKGATRYLGVFLSYDGWQVQQEKLYKMAKSFYW